jgi:N-methylhydantoinase A/oxoprolinase/acetone carboxylase beta subunit
VTRVGADVGGTFTDVVVTGDDGRLTFTKVLSTPPAYDRAVVDAVQSLGGADEVVHGTTVATNAVLEQRGALTAVVTTEGFRDVLELRRMRMPHLYDYFWTKPPPLVERHLRFEVAERVLADGTVRTPLDETDARAAAARLREAGVESIAVCLLHAHLYPAHEQLLGAILREELREIPVSLSSEILREQQEYERTATTVVNAYVRPLMALYVDELRRGLGDAQLTIMQSSGGVMSAADAAERPVYALESGPAAGVVAARALGEALGHPNAIAFDMGGTTAKASLIENGRVSRSQEYEVGASLSAGSRLLRGSGELIRIPTIDIAEVGAGGGSIAWLDDAGTLNVGPRSAGASPGPACYGRGGEDPTVTDANVALGYIPEGRIADGGIEISRARAEAALARIAAPAQGVHDLANATMMRALRAVSTEKGRDAGDFVLIASGGSGPVHAAALAAELGVRTAIVPPLAGLFSAIGLLHARAEWHDVRFCRINARAPDLEELRRLDAEMRRDADDWQRVADVRYRGQSWSVPIDFPGEIDEASVATLVERFEAEHELLYGTRLESGSPVDIRAVWLVSLGPKRAPLSPSDNLLQGRKEVGSRLADFGDGFVDVPVRSRGSLAEPADGPLLVDEYDTTVVVPPGWTVRLDPSGALVLDHVAVEVRSTRHDDAIAVRIVGNALATLADEMATTVFRTAHSAVVRDAMDFSAALCAPSGETVAQAVTIPLQLGSIPNAMKTLLEKFGGSFEPGDVYLVNDPFDGASHTPDIFIVKPSFAGERLVGFAVTVAHHGDVGGRVPGTIACDSTEVFQEGLRLPWLKLVDRGEPVEGVYEIIRSNVRLPHELLGDLASQVAACTIGDRGLQELAARYERLDALMAGLLDHTERLLRGEIASWPDGVAEFVDYIGSDGIDVCNVPIAVRLTVRGDELVADI